MVYYQRVFYRFTPMSEVEVPNAIVIEERSRFQPKGQDAIPMGPNTIILRDGNVQDGEIGEDLFTYHHHGDSPAGMMSTTIATAMYLAGNPDLCQGNMLQLGAGIESLLGCAGASLAQAPKQAIPDDDDILTISKTQNRLFPSNLERLTISDASPQSLERALKVSATMGVPKSKLDFIPLDWRIRNVETRQARGQYHPEFSSVVASGLSFTYPEAKELARTVAHRLKPSAPSLTLVDRTPVPRFVLLIPENEEDSLVDLRHLLERGYKMATATHYLKVEQLVFHLQKTSKPESMLDDLELEVAEVRELPFTALTAQHHPEYAGGGSGELFFPMETGAYERMNSDEAAARNRRGPW